MTTEEYLARMQNAERHIRSAIAYLEDTNFTFDKKLLHDWFEKNSSDLRTIAARLRCEMDTIKR